jgi:membrane dipeptidase
MTQTPVFDGHNDLITRLRNEAGYAVTDLDQSQPTYHTDLPRLVAGGVGAQFWSAWVPPTLPAAEAVVATLEQIDGIHRLVAAYPDQLGFARTADEVEARWSEHRIASLIGVEGGHTIAESLPVLRTFARLGVRYLTLTHIRNVPWADSGTDDPVLGGLNDEGRAVVRELNRLGLLVDLSHTSADTQRDAIAVSSAPVLFSHSSAYAVNPHPRNVTDDVLELVAQTGGVVQVTFVPDFVSARLAEWTAELRAAADTAGAKPDFLGWWKPIPKPGAAPAAATAVPGASDFEDFVAAWSATHPRPSVGVADVVEHVEHIRAVAGVDHVGLGGDYDGIPWQPDGLNDVSGYPNLLAALAERGWSSGDLDALTGRNVLRVLRAAEDAATDFSVGHLPGLWNPPGEARA